MAAGESQGWDNGGTFFALQERKDVGAKFSCADVSYVDQKMQNNRVVPQTQSELSAADLVGKGAAAT